MWLAAAVGIIIVGFSLDRAFKRSNPKAYNVFSSIVWMIEGILIAIAVIGGLYQYWTG